LIELASARKFPSQPLLDRKDVAIVQMGDLFDRGKYSLLCYQIITIAEAYIGVKVIPLMGNHELMTIIEPEWYEQLVHPEDDIRSDRDKFNRYHGTLWKPMVDKLLGMIQLNSGSDQIFTPFQNPSSLFIHAGISEEFLYKFNMIAPKRGTKFIPPPLFRRDRRPEEPSTRTSMNAREFNEMFIHDLYFGSREYLEEKYEQDYSPFTMRNYSEVNEPHINCEEVDRVLGIFGVARIIVGHMPSITNRIRFNCGGKIILTDMASSRYMHGGNDESNYQPNIIEINFDTQTGGLINMVSVIFENGENLIEEEIYDSNGPRYRSINEWASDAAEAQLVRAPLRQDLATRLNQIPIVSSRRFIEDIDLSSSESLDDEENDENKENGIKSGENVIKRAVEEKSSSLRSPLAQIDVPFYKDEFVIIFAKKIDDIDGYIMKLSEKSQSGNVISKLADEVLFEDAHPGFPSIHDRTSGKYIEKFLGTDVSVLLSDLEGMITHSAVSHMRLILLHLHKHSICIGFDTSKPRRFSDMETILSFFAMNPDDESVELLNLSRIYSCNNDQSSAEIALFDKTFSGLFKKENRKAAKVMRKNGQREDPIVIPDSDDDSK